jgi:hypothetical protein
MIELTTDFIKYFDGIRRRTMKYIRIVSEDLLFWSPKEGDFTRADIICHISAVEVMFVRVVTEGQWKYNGHKAEGEQSLNELISSLETTHAKA